MEVALKLKMVRLNRLVSATVKLVFMVGVVTNVFLENGVSLFHLLELALVRHFSLCNRT